MSTNVPTDCMDPGWFIIFSESIKEDSLAGGQRGAEVSLHNLSSGIHAGAVPGS